MGEGDGWLGVAVVYQNHLGLFQPSPALCLSPDSKSQSPLKNHCLNELLPRGRSKMKLVEWELQMVLGLGLWKC